MSDAFKEYESSGKITTDEVVSADEAVKPYDRVLVSRLKSIDSWTVVSNPRWDIFTRAMHTVLRNFANDYVEKKNCGVIQRMIRVEDAVKYGIYDTLKPEWVLKRDKV